VTLDIHQGVVRLRATLPPKPSEPAASPWKQRRISTGLRFPDQASEAVKLAERLGNAIERTLRAKEPFDWSEWERSSRGSKSSPIGAKPQISGVDAIRQTEQWWEQQRKRSSSAATTWEVDYARPLRPLLQIPDLQPEHLLHLVQATELGTRSRRRCSQAAATVAKALGLSAELQQQIRVMGKGYSPRTDTAPRDIPADEELETFIDGLPSQWQWPIGICAVYGARPHEALLYAEVMPSKLLAITDGKTGSRISMALPAQWIERWDLMNKRLPAINSGRNHKDVGTAMRAPFCRAGVTFRPYDLRHAWAVRAIYSPKIGPSMAAKSLGHSVQVHSQVYQKWFDASGMEALQAELIDTAD
jgi:integrase